MSYYVKKLFKKNELLKAKSNADIPNYLQLVYNSIHIYYHQSVKYFPESDS